MLLGAGPTPMNANRQGGHAREVHHGHHPLIDQSIEPCQIAGLQAAIVADRIQDVLGHHLDERVGRLGGGQTLSVQGCGTDQGRTQDETSQGHQVQQTLSATAAQPSHP